MNVSSNQDREVLAKDITCCEECPLLHEDCPGGWTSGPGGSPIEPPCTSWTDDQVIYAGMYDKAERDYSSTERKWASEAETRREAMERAERRTRDVEQAKRLIRENSRYSNAMQRSSFNYDGYDWFCPECRAWFHPYVRSFTQGVEIDHCYRCGTTLAHSDLLNPGHK